MIEGKDRLNNLFKALRKRKLLARQRFLCCGSCASSQMSIDLKEERNRDKVGGIYYHSQDAERLEHGYVWLGFGPREGEHEYNEQGYRDVGMIVMEEAAKLDLPVVWNGSPGMRIKIVFNGKGV